MRTITTTTAIAFMLLACDDEVAGDLDDDCGTYPCAVPEIDHSQPVDCKIAGCTFDLGTRHMQCDVSMWLHAGGVGDFGVRLQGGPELDWNELPTNLDAGGLEAGGVPGETMCGVVSLTIPEPTPDYIEIVCESTGEGFATDQLAI